MPDDVGLVEVHKVNSIDFIKDGLRMNEPADLVFWQINLGNVACYDKL